jgi:hypothetical protein
MDSLEMLFRWNSKDKTNGFLLQARMEQLKFLISKVKDIKDSAKTEVL